MNCSFRIPGMCVGSREVAHLLVGLHFTPRMDRQAMTTLLTTKGIGRVDCV